MRIISFFATPGVDTSDRIINISSMSTAQIQKTSKRRPIKSKLSARLREPRVGLIAAALLVVALGAAANLTNTRARASAQTQFCAQKGNPSSGLCLNDWNNGGLNNEIKMWSGGAPNEDFYNHYYVECGGFVTSSCPFSGYSWSGGWNTSLQGLAIEQVHYGPRNLCVGSGLNDDRTLMKTCSDETTYFVREGYALINVYWTNRTNVKEYLCSQGVRGGPGTVAGYQFSGSCQWPY
jgi:hypothetical protein